MVSNRKIFSDKSKPGAIRGRKARGLQSLLNKGKETARQPKRTQMAFKHSILFPIASLSARLRYLPMCGLFYATMFLKGAIHENIPVS